MKKHKNYFKSTIIVTIIAGAFLILYIVLFILNYRTSNRIFEIKEVFINVSSGLIVGVVLFNITNMRDNELRGLQTKIEYLSKIIDVYNDYYEMVLFLSKKKIKKKELKKYCISIETIKKRYKQIRLNKVYKETDSELHKYITKNIGQDLFKKARTFNKAEQLEKYINSNKSNVENVRRDLILFLGNYQIQYNKIVN